MHIPPYYKRKSWQRFLVGTFFGGVLAYCVLLYMHGAMYERLLEQRLDLQSQVTTLKNQNKALLENQEDLNQKSEESNTVKSIEIMITNGEELKLDKLIVHQLKELIKKDISHLVGQDVDIVSESSQLLESTIENKNFRVDEMTYKFTVIKLTITERVVITMDGEIEG